ncbi:c-type cytochrome [bacterium]|nr:c-type cytochrome [bacterium]
MKLKGLILTSAALAALASSCGGGGSAPQQDLDNELRQALNTYGVGELAALPAHSAEKVALGRALFFDKLLSGNRDMSCATCHDPREAGGDGLSLSVGVGGSGIGHARTLGDGKEFIPRNAPEIFERGSVEFTSMFWDSRVNMDPQGNFRSPAMGMLPQGLDSVLAAQAMFPVTSRAEMRGFVGDNDVLGDPNELAPLADNDFPGMWSGLMDRVMAVEEYRHMFADAYPAVDEADFGFQHAANAIAAFEGTGFSFRDTPFDNYLSGDDSAMTDTQKEGALLFYGAAGCARCHTGSALTDQQHYNFMVPALGPGKQDGIDPGFALTSHNDADRFSFRTPPLRNVELTGPWMHDGSFTDLRSAVKHMLDCQDSVHNYDPLTLKQDVRATLNMDQALMDDMLATISPAAAERRELTEAQIDQLMAFLHALTDPSAATEMPALLPASVPSGLPVD